MKTSEETPTATPPPTARRRLKLHHAAILLLALVAVVAIRAKLYSRTSEAAVNDILAPANQNQPPQTVSPSDNSTEENASTEPAQPSLFGSWRDDYYGERTMTFRPDGTGVMVIKLDSVGQALYGEKLLFNLKWENRDGVLAMQFTGGEPKTAVATISQIWGDRHEQKIELLTESDLHLRSTDSQNLYKLKHVDE